MLLLDEPTNNLDLDSIRAMKEAVVAYQGACIIASHDMNFVNGTCDRIYHIAQGKLVRLEGGTEEFKARVGAETAEEARRLLQQLHGPRSVPYLPRLIPS